MRVKIPSRGFNGHPGLVDENETAEQAALRELEEETGYIGEEVIDVSTILASDPGWRTNGSRCDRGVLF